MIIQCINCNKKFEVNSSLIPDEGRNIQCGSCNHRWFYQNISKTYSLDTKNKAVELTSNELDSNDIHLEKDFEHIVDLNIEKNNLPTKKANDNYPERNQINKFSLSKLLSYIVVLIISCVAIVIFLDTFKSPLNNIFPQLELILYNLFESLEDMYLFLKNLIL